MQEQIAIKTLQDDLNFSSECINKLKLFSESLILENKKHNFISKKTESDIWNRHILDSAQLVKFINFSKGSLADLGTGGGFPGIVLALFNTNNDFQVKLFEKSPVKRKFLEKIVKKYDIKAQVLSNIYDNEIDVDYIVSRAFKKFEKIIQVSREIVKKPHKLIVLKGANAEEEINKAFIKVKYPYKLEKSMTDKNSKIIIIDFN
jgi:16S rRNA (guanine527-N7)-methyltransferase